MGWAIFDLCFLLGKEALLIPGVLTNHYYQDKEALLQDFVLDSSR